MKFNILHFLRMFQKKTWLLGSRVMKNFREAIQDGPLQTVIIDWSKGLRPSSASSDKQGDIVLKFRDTFLQVLQCSPESISAVNYFPFCNSEISKKLLKRIN